LIACCIVRFFSAKHKKNKEFGKQKRLNENKPKIYFFSASAAAFLVVFFATGG
jgi:hypothetical protein